MRKKIIAGNWKMNKTPSETVQFINSIKGSLNDKENDVIYIQSMNSDGAGGYVVAWKIEKNIYKERAIFNGF
jgi:hypothetical protein